MKNLYKEEVKELTNLLRNEWSDIQEILIKQNLFVNNTYLLGFYESEEGIEYGLFYTEKSELLRFEKSEEKLEVNIVSELSIKSEFPQVVVLDEISDFEKW